MKGQHTHFQAHQRIAKSNSRKLSIAFVSCLLLSAASYCGLTFLIFNYTNLKILSSGLWAGIVENKNSFNADNPIAALFMGLIVAVICIAVVLWAYYHKKHELEQEGGDEIARSLGGMSLPAYPTLRQKQYQNVVEEMAVASGISLPEMLYLPKDNSINAFVTGGADESVCITVSQGALDFLKREELQALIAHEFGHIANRDVFLNNRLSAILYGFFCIKSLLIYEHDDDENTDFFSVSDFNETDRETQSKKAADGGFSLWSSSRGDGVRFGLLGFALLAISWLMIFFGQLLQAAFSRQREWLADAHAVQYTRNKDALAGVFQKAMSLQFAKVNTPAVADESAHFLFINYQSKWLSTHPPTEQRLARYGYVPFQDELQSIAYKLKQYKHANQQLEEQQRGVKKPTSTTMVTASGVVLGLAGAAEDGDNSDTAASENPNSSQFFMEKFYPLLAIREYQKSLVAQADMTITSAVVAVLAQFVLLSNRTAEQFQTQLKWSDKLAEKVQEQITYLNSIHPTTHIQTFIHHLPILRQYADKPTLIKQVNIIFKADNALSLCEMSYLLCLHHTLKKTIPDSERQQDFRSLIRQITHIINVVAQISNDDENKQAANFELLKKGILPTATTSYQPQALDNHNIKKLYSDIKQLIAMKALFRKNLLTHVEKNMLLDGHLSVEQNHLLFALKTVLR